MDLRYYDELLMLLQMDIENYRKNTYKMRIENNNFDAQSPQEAFEANIRSLTNTLSFYIEKKNTPKEINQVIKISKKENNVLLLINKICILNPLWVQFFLHYNAVTLIGILLTKFTIKSWEIIIVFL